MFHKYCRLYTVISALLLCLIVFPAFATDDSYVTVEAECIGTDRAQQWTVHGWKESVKLPEVSLTLRPNSTMTN